MRVISGAGQFEIKISGVVKQDGNVVLEGKMGYWETQLILEPREALGLAKSLIIPLLRAILGI